MSAFFAHFHFLRPLWLLALVLLPLLLWQWRRSRDAGNPWRAACDPHLLAHLLQEGAGHRGRLVPLLFSIGYAIAVFALAGPAFRQLPEPLSRSESALIVALDLSDRMRSTDLKPDRLSRARYKVADLLDARTEGQTALIAYAGDAFTVAPLTDDARSLRDLLASLVPETMPVPGQRTDRAIALAQKLLHDAGYAEGRLLLVTDRADERALAAAERAAESGLSIAVLGVGTAQAAPVALPQGGFVQDENGDVLLPNLDEGSLRELATAGDGSYAALRVDGADLVALGLLDAPAGAGKLREDERTRAEYRDEGPFLLLALLPLAALAFRRGWLACLVLAMALPAPRAEAMDWGALWQRRDQRAYEALQEQDPARALELAKDPALRGSAAYRAEDYAQAADAFAQAPATADAHYNRGNALAQAKKYEEALSEYGQALALSPGMEDAAANKKAVEDFLEQQKKQQDQQQKDQQQQGENGESGEPQEPQEGEEQDSEKQEGSQSKDQQGESKQREGDAEQPSDERNDAQAQEQQQQQAQEQFAEQMEKALKEGEQQEEAKQVEEVDPREAEKRQAVEQWLRRVPDDPGGLLRRKFALEYQRRLRENQGDQP
jgi:Ca-activated chloride channel family protein